MAQYWIYWPIMLIVARFNLHIIGVVLAVKDKKFVRDTCLMGGFFAYTYGLCQLAPAGLQWTFYWTAHVGISLLHVVIGLNHFHMPMYNDVIKPADGGWIKHQLHTTCNITNGPFMNWWAGGLQQQVEHHLFPQLPRSHLVRSPARGVFEPSGVDACVDSVVLNPTWGGARSPWTPSK